MRRVPHHQPASLGLECPRDEPAARAWLESLSLKQVLELSRRANGKPTRPDWNLWKRKLVEEVREPKRGGRTGTITAANARSEKSKAARHA